VDGLVGTIKDGEAVAELGCSAAELGCSVAADRRTYASDDGELMPAQ
jgi:hypothetical protein